MANQKRMIDILTEAGIEARPTKYGGHQAVFLHPSTNVETARNLLEAEGYKVKVYRDYGWPLLRDATVRYSVFVGVMP